MAAIASSPPRSRPSPPSSPGQTQQPSSRNPISLRLWKVIGSTSFDDPSSREALQAVSERYTHDGASVDTKRRRYRLQDEVPMSEVSGEAAAMARRHFKRDLETQLSEGSARFLEAFGEVDRKLQVLRLHMQDMQTRCDQVQRQLEQANTGTQFLLERANVLNAQKASTELRAQVAQLFLARFTLSQEEIAALTSRDVPVGEALFQAMDRVTGIRRDCQSLFAYAGPDTEEGDDAARVGTEIMAATNEQLEAGYTKIHRWCQAQFRNFNRETQLEVSPLLRSAVLRLRERPALRDDAIELLNSTRSSHVLQSFLDALTRGGPGGLPRPIEIHAHDPTRYVGDMLAWVHQATAGESEFLDALFGLDRDRRRMMGEVRQQADTTEDEALARACLDKHLKGLCRPLRSRVQLTIKSQEGVIMAYKIANLLQFYLFTMQRTIGDEAQLTKTLLDIHTTSHEAFFASLDAQGRSLLRFLHPPDANLAPPLALRDSSQVLHEIMSVYDTSLVDEADRETDFARILEAAVDPPMEMCRRMADMRQKGGQWEKDVFLINCDLYLQHVLESYAFTQPRRVLIERDVDQHVRSLLNEHRERLLQSSGLAAIAAALAEKDAETPLSRIPAAEPKAVTSAIKAFDNFISHLNVLSSPSLSLLSSPRLATLIHHRGLERVNQAYADIYAAVMDKSNKYEFASTLLTRATDEVAMLLGINDMY